MEMPFAQHFHKPAGRYARICCRSAKPVQEMPISISNSEADCPQPLCAASLLCFIFKEILI